METNRPPRDRFIDPRVVLAFAFCSVGMLLATLSLAATSPAGSWSIVSSPNSTPAESNSLDGVTCVAADDCWAVGSFVRSRVPQTLIQHWDGVAWTVVPSPNTSASEENTLRSVTCPSATECWAVGTRGEGDVTRTLIQRWNGSSWSIIPSPNKGPKGNALTGVTCTGTEDCWAVGFYLFDDLTLRDRFGTLIQRWNGTAWSIVESPDYRNPDNPASVTGLSVLRSVTCTSASDCWAVGWGKAILEPATTLTLRWDGTEWSMVRSPGMGTSQSFLASVTCTSASDCWAVGDYTDSDSEFSQTLIERWNGSKWSIVASPNVSRGNALTGVSCTSASDCWAVGAHYIDTTSRTFIQNWNGEAWTAVTSADAAGKEQNALQSVICSGADCWAVGSSAAAQLAPRETLIQRYIVPATTAPAQLQNISTRLRVQTGENVLIGGFIVTGSAPKKIVLRAIGPSLTVNGRLMDPTLELFDNASVQIAANDNWKDSPQRAEIEASGIAPTDGREAAIARTLAPGSYTAAVRGAGGATGIGLIEAYDLDSAADSRLANISTRGFVETGDNVMIGGLIVGPAERDSTRVMLRAIGPSLTAKGVAGALQDPTVALHDANGALLAANDNWKESQRADVEGTGIPPTDDRESAIVRVLTPGLYTAIVRGQGNSTGVALVEAYNLGSP